MASHSWAVARPACAQYATSVTVHEDFCFPIPAGIPDENSSSVSTDFFELKSGAFGSSHGRKTGVKLTQHLNLPFSFFQLQFALTLLGQPPTISL
jgi:hypothetical protein